MKMLKQDKYWGNVGDIRLDDSATNESEVTLLNNRIYFYSEVTRPQCLALNKNIQTLSDAMCTNSHNYDIPVPPIRLHINSYGGSVFAGLSSVDYIISSKAPVHSVVEGCAASAATLMSVVAEKRYIHRNSFMLIHQLSSGMWGKFEELKDSIENCEILMQTIRDIYGKHTQIPKKKLDEILKRDLWFDADTCLKYGLVDEII
tara:strand:- start:526 stop:1134 length:609 start_codon:yes stop_codon:yes gene_type:complete